MASSATRKATRNRLETAVSRCSQKCPVPARAEPRPRTLARAVRRSSISQTSPERQAAGPERNREADRADDGEPAECVDRTDLKPAARVPDQVADAAQHVMDEGPGVAEQPDLGERVPEHRVHLGECPFAHGRRDQPDRQQQRAEIERYAGDAMGDRHHHVNLRPIDREMWRERTFDRALAFSHGAWLLPLVGSIDGLACNAAGRERQSFDCPNGALAQVYCIPGFAFAAAPPTYVAAYSGLMPASLMMAANLSTCVLTNPLN